LSITWAFTDKISLMQNIDELFSLLDEQKIEYTIIRRPRVVSEGDDVDILVSKKDAVRLGDLMVQHGFAVAFAATIPGHLIYKKYFFGVGCVVTIDYHLGGLSYEGIVYLAEAGLLYRDSKVLEGNNFVLMLSLHSLFDKGHFSDTYLERVREGVNRNPQFFEEKLGEVLGKVLARLLLGKAARGEKDLRSLKAVALLRCFVLDPRNIYLYFFNKLAKLRYWVAGKFKRRGRLIVLVGADGSGKTTAATALYEQLRNSGQKVVTVYMGWKNFSLPFLTAANERYQEKGGGRRSRFLDHGWGQFFKVGLIFAELYLRYLQLVRPKLNAGFWVVADRYIYDPCVFKVKSQFLKRLVFKLFPRSDLVVYLRCPVEEIRRRKPELVQEEIELMRKYFESGLKDEGVAVVDSTRPLKAITEEILSQL